MYYYLFYLVLFDRTSTANARNIYNNTYFSNGNNTMLLIQSSPPKKA